MAPVSRMNTDFYASPLRRTAVPRSYADFYVPASQASDVPLQALRVANIAFAHGKRVARPLPRARLVARVEGSDDVNRDIGHIEPAVVALLARRTATDLPPLSGEPGNALILAERPGDIVVETSAPGRQLFVLSESYHDGWQATIDGTKPCPIVRVYGDFMGCVVPEGLHEVHFHFDPKSLRDGKRTSLAAASLTLVFYFAATRFAPARRRNHPDAAEP